MQQNNGLDKNQLISFAVFSMILIGFMFYFKTETQKLNRNNWLHKPRKQSRLQKQRCPKPT